MRKIIAVTTLPFTKDEEGYWIEPISGRVEFSKSCEHTKYITPFLKLLRPDFFDEIRTKEALMLTTSETQYLATYIKACIQPLLDSYPDALPTDKDVYTILERRIKIRLHESKDNLVTILQFIYEMCIQQINKNEGIHLCYL